MQKYLNDNENTLEGIQLQELAPTAVVRTAIAAHNSIIIDEPPS